MLSCAARSLPERGWNGIHIDEESLSRRVPRRKVETRGC